MPIIKSAKKRMKQNLKRRQRNYRTRRMLHDAIRKVNEVVKAGNKADAVKALSESYKVIDTAVKKNIIHKNNGGRKKSQLAKMVAGLK